MQFSYTNPTVIHFGKGQIATVQNAIPDDARVLVIYGGGSIKQNGVYDQVVAALAQHNWLEFSGVEANPTKETLDKAVAMVKEQGIDFILAVGGGSVVDGSKYVAAASRYAGDGWDILAGKHQVTEATPLAAILTLPATGSESNGGAVITQAKTKEKLAFMSPHVYPRFAVLDPDTMESLPERQLINGLVDAWVHVCEQYLTEANQAMVQDGYAEALLKNLLELGHNFANRDSDRWRANLMWTANQALNGLIGSGVPHDWATHLIGHELTAQWHLDHAHTLSLVQPSLLRNQIDSKRAKLEQMGRNVFGLPSTPDLAEKTIDAIEAFYHQLGMPTTFADHGMSKSDAIDTVISQLQAHGMVAIGEKRSITPEVSRQILQQVIV